MLSVLATASHALSVLMQRWGSAVLRFPTYSFAGSQTVFTITSAAEYRATLLHRAPATASCLLMPTKKYCALSAGDTLHYSETDAKQCGHRGAQRNVTPTERDRNGKGRGKIDTASLLVDRESPIGPAPPRRKGRRDLDTEEVRPLSARSL